MEFIKKYLTFQPTLETYDCILIDRIWQNRVLTWKYDHCGHLKQSNKQNIHSNAFSLQTNQKNIPKVLFRTFDTMWDTVFWIHLPIQKVL